MKHTVYIDRNSNELENLILGIKKMVILSGSIRNAKHLGIEPGDTIDFAYKKNNQTITVGKAMVEKVFVSGKLSREESQNLVESFNDKLMLTNEQKKKYKNKQCLVLISISKFVETNYNNHS